MTIVVGIRCADGIVVGTDSTFTIEIPHVNPDYRGEPTIAQPGRKLYVFDHVIVAASGPLGDIQRFAAIVKRAWGTDSGKLSKKAAIEIGAELSKLGQEDFESTHLKAARIAALVACATTSGPVLLEFELGRFQPEVKEPDGLWHSCIGIAQPTGDPFLAFLRKTVLRGNTPTFEEAKLIAFWSIQHACDVSPGGVGKPIQMAVIDRQDSTKKSQNVKWKARELNSDELGETEGAVKSAESYMAGCLDAAPGAVIPPPNPAPEPLAS